MKGTTENLCNDLVAECISFLQTKEMIKVRQVSRQWKDLVDYRRWDLKNQNLIIYYRTIFEKRLKWFHWLNRNNIDPNFSRTTNMIAFSILYSSPEIVKWFIDRDYPLSPSNQMLELKAIRTHRNILMIALIKNYLKKQIADGREEYREWIIRLEDPAFLFERVDV